MAKRKANILDLPTDMMFLIFNRLDHTDRLSVSVVSKYFRSLTSEFVHKLNFNFLPSNSALRKIFTRFSSVRRVSIHSPRIRRALMAISNSKLEIEGLEIWGNPSYPKLEHMITLSRVLGKVKALKLDCFSFPVDDQAVDFILMFSALEELDLSGGHLWSDERIEKLGSNSPNLRSIILDHNYNLTDRSFHALSNCVNLEHISFQSCSDMTARGLCAFVRKRPNLKMLELPRFLITSGQEADALTLAKTISLCENLDRLSIDGCCITDVFLRIIAELRSSLTTLMIEPDEVKDTGYTMAGLSLMLQAFPGLTNVYIELPYSEDDTQDKEMSHLVKSLPRLRHAHLVSQSGICATLFSLIQNCPLLECIHLNTQDSNTRYEVPQLIRKNYSIWHIYIRPRPDTFFRTALKSFCPSWDDSIDDYSWTLSAPAID